MRVAKIKLYGDTRMLVAQNAELYAFATREDGISTALEGSRKK
jgi:hypothetical protein